MYKTLVHEYRNYLRLKGYAKKSITKYLDGAIRFNEYLLKERGVRRIQDVTREDIKCYQSKVYSMRRQRDDMPLGLSRKSGLVNAVKNYFKFLLKTGYVLYNPAAGMDLPRVRREVLREVLKEREIKKILKNIKGNTPVEARDRAMLEVLYSTGIRNTEMRNIKMKDIDTDRRELRIREGKGGKDRIVPLGRIASAWVEEYIREVRPKFLWDKDTEYLFISVRGRKLTIGMPNYIVKKYAKRAGIKKNVKTHMLRHTCATHLLKGGADIRYVQELLGHSSLDSTQIYTKIEIGDLKKVHRKTHPREKL